MIPHLPPISIRALQNLTSRIDRRVDALATRVIERMTAVVLLVPVTATVSRVRQRQRTVTLSQRATYSSRPGMLLVSVIGFAWGVEAEMNRTLTDRASASVSHIQLISSRFDARGPATRPMVQHPTTTG